MGSQFPDQGLNLGHGNESAGSELPDHQEVPLLILKSTPQFPICALPLPLALLIKPRAAPEAEVTLSWIPGGAKHQTWTGLEPRRRAVLPLCLPFSLSCEPRILQGGHQRNCGMTGTSPDIGACPEPMASTIYSV